MRIGLKTPTAGGSTTAEYAVRAEERGYHSIWQDELWGDNPFVDLAVAAHQTTDIRLGTAIVNVYSRSPAVIAMGANSLDRVSDSRLLVGIGASTPKAIEDLHGMSYERPVRRTHETVELLDAFLGGAGPVDYEGEVFQVADVPALDADVPIYNAALGPANRRATGRLCDGWLPNNVPFSNLSSAFETVAAAAREADRDPAAIEVAPWIHVAVDDEEPAAARDLVRGTVAYYVGSSEASETAVGAVYPEAAERVASAWRAGDRDDARATVTAEMVDDLGCAGTTAAVRDRLRWILEETPTDLPIVDVPAGASEATIDRTIAAVAPESL